jgi:hypothetical protein
MADESVLLGLLIVAKANFSIRCERKAREPDSGGFYFNICSRMASIDAKNILLASITLLVSALGFLQQITYRLNFQLQRVPH